jgi:hypothetical protein
VALVRVVRGGYLQPFGDGKVVEVGKLGFPPPGTNTLGLLFLRGEVMTSRVSPTPRIVGRFEILYEKMLSMWPEILCEGRELKPVWGVEEPFLAERVNHPCAELGQRARPAGRGRGGSPLPAYGQTA